MFLQWRSLTVVVRPTTVARELAGSVPSHRHFMLIPGSFIHQWYNSYYTAYVEKLGLRGPCRGLHEGKTVSKQRYIAAPIQRSQLAQGGIGHPVLDHQRSKKSAW